MLNGSETYARYTPNKAYQRFRIFMSYLNGSTVSNLTVHLSLITTFSLNLSLGSILLSFFDIVVSSGV